MSKKHANVINRLWYHAVSLMLCAAVAIIFILPAQIPDITNSKGSFKAPSNINTPHNNASYILNTDTAHDPNLVPFTHVTPVKSNHSDSLSTADFFRLFHSGLAGKRSDTSFIRLSKDHDTHWLLARITNTTDNKRWVLDLGKRLDGRIGGFQSLKILSINNNEKSYTTLFDSSNNANLEQRTIYSHYIPIEIPPHSTTLLGVYISSPITHDTVIPARFYSFTEALDAQDNILTIKNIIPFLLISTSCFFALIFILKKNWLYIYGSLFFLGSISLLAIENRVVIEENSWETQSLFIHFIPYLTLIVGLIFCKFFCFIKEENPISNGTIYILSAILLLLSFLTPSYSLDKDTYAILTTAFSFISLFALTSICAFQTLEGKNGSGFLAIGWLIQLIGYVLTALATYSFIEQTLLMLNAKWYGTVLQGLIFVLAVTKREKIINLKSNLLQQKQPLKGDSIERLRQSKEAADQARLLKVIERERLLLTELREREAKRTEEMRIAKEAAHEANRSKSAFLAVVGHEIRTPMTGILGMVRLLLDTKLTKEQKDYTRTIQDSGESMLALLNDILDFEKIEQGKMNIESISFDLNRLVDSVINLMSGHASQKGITLKTNIDPELPHYLIGDPTRLRQILLNLTGNGLKFTAEGSVKIHISVATPKNLPKASESKHTITFAVEDTGIGITEEAQQNLFDPFSQADVSVFRQFGGSGLGLAICKGLVEQMGSTLNVISRVGEGSTFYFSLDMKEGSSQDTHTLETPKAPQETNKPRDPLYILIVDDNAINQKVIIGLLARTGHNFKTAYSAEDAFQCLLDEKFDLILMDIELPGINGDECTRMIRALDNPDISNVPVIALTGNVRDEDVARFYKNGMDGFVAKPIDPEQLTKSIYEMIDVFGTKENRKERKSKDISEDSINKFSNNELNPGEETMQVTEGYTDSDPHKVFSDHMLGSLKNTIDQGQLNQMVDDLLIKTREIIEDLADCKEDVEKNTAFVFERAHELKGMAGNFGLNEISHLAHIIEEKIKQENLEGIEGDIAELPQAESRAQEALKEWLES